MITFSIKLSKKDESLLRKFSKKQGVSMQDFIKAAVLGKIEDEYDSIKFDEIWEEEKSQKHISHDFLKKSLDLDS